MKYQEIESGGSMIPILRNLSTVTIKIKLDDFKRKKYQKNYQVDSVKKRIDPRTTGKFWTKVRDIAGVVGGVTSSILLAPLPPKIELAVKIVTGISFAIAGRAWVDKSKSK